MKGYKPGVTKEDVSALKAKHKERRHEEVKEYVAKAKTMAMKKACK